MIVRIARIAALTLLSPVLAPAVATAQDVPGIEICTVEKTMERRTSCLQSNVDFLQKTIGKLAIDHQQKIDAANRQIEGLKAVVAALQKTVDDLQAAQKKTAEAQKKAEVTAGQGCSGGEAGRKVGRGERGGRCGGLTVGNNRHSRPVLRPAIAGLSTFRMCNCTSGTTNDGS